MRVSVPDEDTESTLSTTSYHSVTEMAEIPMTDTDQVVLSREEAQAMRQLLAERRQLGAQTNAESAQVPRMRRDAVLPRWNGAPQDFLFFVERLETRIETD
ncbi:hypothetical protein K3495_g7090 [Podosphaera aphanis]|nr:hypothetical protein K3495_g7090 [Podosphaera aphanis]